MTRGSIGEAEGPVSPPRFMGAGDARHSKGLGTKSARHVDGRMTTRDDRRSGQTTRARDAFDPERRLEGTTRSRRHTSGRETWTTPPFGRRSGAAGERGRSATSSIRREKATLRSRSPDARATAPPGRLDRIRSTRTSKGDGSVEATTRERARPCAGRQPARCRGGTPTRRRRRFFPAVSVCPRRRRSSPPINAHSDRGDRV